MCIKDLLFINSEMNVEDLVDMSFGIVDITDATVHVGDNVWRDMRDYEKQQVDEKMKLETLVVVEYAGKDDTCSIDMYDGRHGEDRKLYSGAYEDMYLEGLHKGFSL
jgi:hypothetical protein